MKTKSNFLLLIFTVIALIAGFAVLSLFAVHAQSGDNFGNDVLRNKAYALEVTQAESGDVAVNEENFPDATFRNWILDSANLGGAGSDGVLTEEEIGGIDTIYVLPADGQRIKSLEGISCFTALTDLIVPNHEIATLDLTHNVNLSYVNCSYNRLTVLKVAGLSKIKTLYCEFNYLTELDLTGLTELTTLYSRHNVLTGLDLSTNTKLRFIEAFDNMITDIDVTMLTDLEFLHIDHNKLTRLDMSKNLNLKGVGFVVRNNDVREIVLPSIDGFTVYYDDFAEQDPIQGYEKTEWYSDSLYTQPVISDVQAEGQTLYGKRVANKYTINFEGNGGSGLPSSVVTYYDEETALPSETPVKKGYEFVGWGTDAYNPSTTYSAGESVLNLAGKKYDGEKVTLYAQWEAITYTLNFDSNASDTTGEMQSVTLKYGQSAPLPANAFARPKYDFIGWAYTPEGEVAFTDRQAVMNLSFTQGETVRLYAVWELTAEEIAKPYVSELQTILEQYSSVQYVAEDWDNLFASYSASLKKLSDAGKNEQIMSAEVEACRLALKKISTLTDRVKEITDGWKNRFSAGLQYVYNPPVPLGEGKNTLSVATAANENADSVNLAAYSSLTDAASKEQVAVLAGTEIASDLMRIKAFLSAGDWIIRAEDACFVPKNEVRSADWSYYDAIIKDYELLGAEQKTFISGDVLAALDETLAFAKTKGYAISLLTQYHSQFDSEDYYLPQWEELSSLFSSSVSDIEAASDEEEIKSAFTAGKDSMDSVLTKAEYDAAQPAPDEPDETPQPPQENPDTPEDNTDDSDQNSDGNNSLPPSGQEDNSDGNGMRTAIIVLASVGGVAAVAVVVILVVRKKRRKSK